VLYSRATSDQKEDDKNETLIIFTLSKSKTPKHKEHKKEVV
jgi:hypothetical protein